MIVDKKNGNVVSGNTANSQNTGISSSETVTTETVASEMPDNGIIDVYEAIKEILKNTRWKYNDTKSELIFKTVQFNGNQYESIVSGDENVLYEMAFPAALVNFINLRWTSTQKTINTGQAELRIQILLNTLNNYDDDKDTEGMYVCQRVIQEIQEHKGEYTCLQKYLQLTFMDSATSFHSGLQSWWLTFAVKFTESSVWAQRHTVKRYIVAPPFTNHSDQDPDTPQVFNHTNLDHADMTYDDHSKFVES